MQLEWMLQASVLGVLFGAAAVLLELMTDTGRRWVWIAGLVSSAAVPFVALVAPEMWPAWSSWRVVEAAAPAAVSAGVGEATEVARGRGAALNPLPVAWLLLSLVCLTWYGAAWVRLRWLSRGCARVQLFGRDVVVSERLGPAVVGLWRPRVIVPRWIMALAPAQQRLVVLHEGEHMRAGDHWVLAAAPLVAVLLPWNLAVWWQLRRLRLAVELDCDARVLSRGARPLDYGRLLLDVAATGGALMAPALAEPRSQLGRRLEAVAGRHRRLDRCRRVAMGTAVAAVLAAGCLVVAPARVVPLSSAVTPPGAAIRDASFLAADTAVRTTARHTTDAVDDRTPHSDASRGSRNVDVSTIARAALPAIGVVPVTRIARLRDPLPSVSRARRAKVLALTGDTVAVPGETADAPGRTTSWTSSGDTVTGPLFVVDGVVIPEGSFAGLGLEPKDIDSIEVMKGAAAVARYGAGGAGGVIAIRTRRGGAPAARPRA